MEIAVREMTFEEEAESYIKEARAEFAKETGNGDCSNVNGILRRGMRIIRKARQEIASREVVRCKDCKHYDKDALWCNKNSYAFGEGCPNWYSDDFCSYGERKDNGLG